MKASGNGRGVPRRIRAGDPSRQARRRHVTVNGGMCWPSTPASTGTSRRSGEGRGDRRRALQRVLTGTGTSPCFPTVRRCCSQVEGGPDLRRPQLGDHLVERSQDRRQDRRAVEDSDRPRLRRDDPARVLGQRLAADPALRGSRQRRSRATAEAEGAQQHPRRLTSTAGQAAYSLTVDGPRPQAEFHDVELPRIELLWWSGCPSWDRALEELREAMSEVGLDPGSLDVREVESEADAEREGSSARRRSGSTAGTSSRPAKRAGGPDVPGIPAARRPLLANAGSRPTARGTGMATNEARQEVGISIGDNAPGFDLPGHRGSTALAQRRPARSDRGRFHLQPLSLRARLAGPHRVTRRATTPSAAFASWPSTPTTPSAIPRTRTRRCSSAFAKSSGGSRTSTTRASRSRASSAPR